MYVDRDYNEVSDDDFAKESHSDSSEKFDNDSAEMFDDDHAEELDKHLDIDKHSIDLAKDFAKHFDSHSAVGVKSNLVQTRMGEWTSQGNDMFYNSNIIPASPWLAAFVFFMLYFIW